MSDLLIQAMSAKQSGDINLAKQLLSQAIVQNPRNEAAWMLMADVVDDVKQRKNCLERVLAINPDNAVASSGLAKLNTTPLEEALRGERSKPAETPKADKTPPFTPPFTWDSQPEQYLALGDLTYPEITGEEPAPLPETPLTFDWANESPEPDKTIDKIFEAVSKPELASEPPPEKETSWLDELRPEEDIVQKPIEVKKPEEKKPEPPKGEDSWVRELVSSEAEEIPIEQPLTDDDFSVNAEPELGLGAFTTDDSSPIPSEDQDSLLWDNPHAKTDRLVILSYRSLIYANPAESDIPHIVGLFNENRMVRDLLGENAYLIKLDNIERISLNPKASNLQIEYRPNGKSVTHELHFSTPQVRDDVMTALKFRLGAGFVQSSHSITMEDKILSPIVILVLVAALVWGLVWGVPLLSAAPGIENSTLQPVLSGIQDQVARFGAFYILLLAGLIGLACVVWMAINLRKPSSQIVLKR